MCKPFFLTTLGFKRNDDGIVKRCMQSAPRGAVSPGLDMRGRHLPANKINKAIITAHINLFNPTVHHYRREHAPNRLYLPSDINVNDMHNDFKTKHPDLAVGRETYRKVIKEMNIGFAVLGCEECEECKSFKQHKDCTLAQCDQCSKHHLHKVSYTESRTAYQEDTTRQDDHTMFVSVDMQKVIMLPRLPGVKSCVFTKRITAYNETFANLGKSNNNTVIVWNESVTGRNAEDVSNTYHMFIKSNRDKKNFVFWADNCSGQNKNWLLFSSLVAIVNSSEIQAERIQIKYLTAGHTFMSADSVHHQIERNLKKAGDVCDWVDFINVLEKARCKVVDMQQVDCLQWQDGSNRQAIAKKKPKVLLSEIVEIAFERGSRTMHFKKSHIQEAYEKMEFLKERHSIELPPRRLHETRISREKFMGLQNLTKFMPQHKRQFWGALLFN